MLSLFVCAEEEEEEEEEKGVSQSIK